LERSLASTTHIPLPGLQLTPPAGLGLSAAVSFVPLGFHFCEQGFVGASLTGPSFSITDPDPTLAVEDKSVNGGSFGPFIYDANELSWQQNSEMPPGQQLKTIFDEPTVEGSVSPALFLSWSKNSRPEASLSVASVALVGKEAKVTLLSSGHALLEGTAGPKIELSIGVSASEIEAETEKEVTEDGSPAAAEENVAEREASYAAEDLSADARVFGVGISDTAVELESTLVIHFEHAMSTDPNIEAAADVSEAHAVSAAQVDALAPDEALGGSTVEATADVGIADILPDLLIFIAF
jgi:hypothetical protein